MPTTASGGSACRGHGAGALAAAARAFVEKTWTWEAHFLRLEAEMIAAADENSGDKPFRAAS